jgi:hypothetical protein
MLENNQENLHESEVSPETVNQQEEIKQEEKEVLESNITEKVEIKEIISAETKLPVDSDKNSENESVDLSVMSMELLLAELKSILENKEVHEVKRNIDFIKKEFNKKHSKKLQEEKKAFLEAGNESIDFHFDNPLKQEFDSLYTDYAVKRKKFYNELDATLQQNLTARIIIIDELKNLIESGDSSTMYKDFKNLQARWNEIGAVPRNRYNDTWKTYQHHVERFYDLLHINKDLRDLDFRHNLEEKLKLIAKSEELLLLTDVEQSFKELQLLHKIWKELGPVDREHRDQVWDQFSNITKLIHDKRQDFYKGLKEGFEDNILKKEEIIKKVKTLEFDQNKSHSDWQKSISKIEQLRKEFIEITNIPRKKNDELWKKFKDATRQFNKFKNDFYKEIKQEQQDNLTLKTQMVKKAQSLKDSEDFEQTSEILKKLQLDWKKVGHVPKKYSDKLWKEFKDACNHFFDKYHKNQDADNQEQLTAFGKKKEFYEQFKVLVDSDVQITYEEVKEAMNQWRSLGSLPHNLKHIEIKFNKLLDKVFGSLSIDNKSKEMLKFKNIMDSFFQQKNYRKLESEQLFIRKKIDDITRENQQLDNNISFFSNAGEDNPMIIKVRKNIEANSVNLELWKEKLRYLASLNY